MGTWHMCHVVVHADSVVEVLVRAKKQVFPHNTLDAYASHW
jgi:hypothetical protein